MQAIRTYVTSIDVKDVFHKALCCTPIVNNLYKTIFYIYAYKQFRQDSNPQKLNRKLASLESPNPEFQLAVRVVCGIGVAILCPQLLYPLLVIDIAASIPHLCTIIHNYRNQKNIPLNLHEILQIIPIVNNLYRLAFCSYSLVEVACTHNWERLKRRIDQKFDSRIITALTAGQAMPLLFPNQLVIANEIIGILSNALWFTAYRVGRSH